MRRGENTWQTQTFADHAPGFSFTWPSSTSKHVQVHFTVTRCTAAHCCHGGNITKYHAQSHPVKGRPPSDWIAHSQAQWEPQNGLKAPTDNAVMIYAFDWLRRLGKRRSAQPAFSTALNRKLPATTPRRGTTKWRAA